MASQLLLLLLLLLSSGAAAADEPQLTDLLSATNGCGGFAALVAATPKASGVLQSHFAGGGGGGLTVFCPDDEAVAAFAPTFRNLSADAQVALLLYHGVGARVSEKALRTMANSGAVLQTLAATNDDDGASYYEISIVLSSSSLRPPGAARVTKTAVDEARLAVHIIDAVMPVPSTTATTCSGFVLMNRVCFPHWAVALLALASSWDPSS